MLITEFLVVTPRSSTDRRGVQDTDVNEPFAAADVDTGLDATTSLPTLVTRDFADPVTPPRQRSASVTLHGLPSLDIEVPNLSRLCGSPPSSMSPSSYATSPSDLCSRKEYQSPTSFRSVGRAYPTIPRPTTSLQQNHSSDSASTQVAMPRQTTSDSQDMSLHTRLWAMENMLHDRMHGLEDELRQLKLQLNAGHEMPPTPPGDLTPPGRSSSQSKTYASVLTSSVRKSLSPIREVVKEQRWMPWAVRKMPPMVDIPLAKQPLAASSLKPFPYSFITSYLGGSDYGNGMYYPATGAKEHQLGRLVNHKMYYLLDHELEPCAPPRPGEHGAKLTVLVRALDTDKMAFDVPLFVTTGELDESGDKLYRYMGHYSQTRWSDRLDYDTQNVIVTDALKQYWAMQLASKDMPEWMREELMTTIWPKPDFQGSIDVANFDVGPLDLDTGSQQMSPKMEWIAYLEDLARWRKEAEKKVDDLTVEGVLRAFEGSDMDASPGLRFYWEYLQCVGFERNFYYVLISALEGR